MQSDRLAFIERQDEALAVFRDHKISMGDSDQLAHAQEGLVRKVNGHGHVQPLPVEAKPNKCAHNVNAHRQASGGQFVGFPSCKVPAGKRQRFVRL